MNPSDLTIAALVENGAQSVLSKRFLIVWNLIILIIWRTYNLVSTFEMCILEIDLKAYLSRSKKFMIHSTLSNLPLRMKAWIWNDVQNRHIWHSWKTGHPTKEIICGVHVQKSYKMNQNLTNLYQNNGTIPLRQQIVRNFIWGWLVGVRSIFRHQGLYDWSQFLQVRAFYFQFYLTSLCIPYLKIKYFLFFFLFLFLFDNLLPNWLGFLGQVSFG